MQFVPVRQIPLLPTPTFGVGCGGRRHKLVRTDWCALDHEIHRHDHSIEWFDLQIFRRIDAGIARAKALSACWHYSVYV